MINVACLELILGANLALGSLQSTQALPQIKVSPDGMGGFAAYKEIGGKRQIVWKRPGNQALAPQQFGKCKPILQSSSWLVYRFVPDERGLVVERVEADGKSAWRHVFRQGGLNEDFATYVGNKAVMVIPPSYGPVWGPRELSKSPREARENVKDRAHNWRVIALDIKSGKVLWEKPELSVGNPVACTGPNTFWSLRLMNPQESYELKKPRYCLESRKQSSGRGEIAFQLPSIGSFSQPVEYGMEKDGTIRFSLIDYASKKSDKKKIIVKVDALRHRAWLISASTTRPLKQVSLAKAPKS